ncbi:MAG TPA: hypothetical protein VG815_06045 [Chloroflexota bacterium]|nr:hypothetical protein [Chloroflexota bacterium]
MATALCVVACLVAAAPGELYANAPPSVTWGTPTNISTGSGLPSMVQLAAGSGRRLVVLADVFGRRHGRNQ